MTSTDTLCMAIMAKRDQVRIACGPSPCWWRISPADYQEFRRQLVANKALGEESAAARLNEHGRVWGMPFIVSDAVPEGTVMYTVDYRTWESLTVWP